jgi:hypothetical protein
MGIQFPNTTTKDPKIYFIMGMARSGTSFLARSIEQGLVKQHGESEVRRIQTENDRTGLASVNEYLLRGAGGDFWNPPSSEAIIESGKNPRHQEMMRDFLMPMRGDFYGIKDPRLSLVLPAWLPIVEGEGDVYVYAAFRKPKRVHESLLERHHDQKCDVEELTRLYNERALENIKLFLEL